jgi:Protein of unknown function (DUF2934)
MFSRRNEAMKRAAVGNAESRPSIIFQSDNVERGRRSSPSTEEIRQRAFEIYMERGGIHGCELEDWLQAERELQEKYNKSSRE